MAFGLKDILSMLSPAFAGRKQLGSLYGKAKPFLFGTKGQQQRTPMFEQEQEDMLSQLLQQGGENFDFSNIEDIEQQRFQQETIPGLAERFTAMGGGQRSSAFQGALGGAASDLGTRLGGLRSQMGAQQLGMGLMPRYQTSQTEGKPGMLQGMGSQIGKMLPMLLGLL